MSEPIKSNELFLSRIYDAQVKQVWDAWVDPHQVAQWWGPRGFTITTVRKDVRAGGDWLYTMHGPDGVDYPNHTHFLEVDRYQRLVYDHGGFEDKPPLFRVRVSFTDLNGKTKMDMTMAFATAEQAAESTWDRLAEYLEKQSSGKEVFVINRSFDVELKTLFEAWTQPNQVMNWTPPVGFTGKYLSADIRPGGESFYVMTGNGISMYGKAKYLELTHLSRLVYTQRFADQNGNTSRHPMAPTWPEVLRTTASFYEEGPKKSRITLQWEVYGEATQEEHDTFKGAKSGMAKGWTGSFDQLEEYLKQMK